MIMGCLSMRGVPIASKLAPTLNRVVCKLFVHSRSNVCELARDSGLSGAAKVIQLRGLA